MNSSFEQRHQDFGFDAREIGLVSFGIISCQIDYKNYSCYMLDCVLMRINPMKDLIAFALLIQTILLIQMYYISIRAYCSQKSLSLLSENVENVIFLSYSHILPPRCRGATQCRGLR